MYEVKIYKAEEIREFDFNVAGQNLSIVTCRELKIYAGNTAYINKKKVQLSEGDIATIENAKQIYFLYSASNSEGVYFDSDLKEFTTSKFGHGCFTPSDSEQFKTILANNSIQILN
jgi:hypothetical protein